MALEDINIDENNTENKGTEGNEDEVDNSNVAEYKSPEQRAAEAAEADVVGEFKLPGNFKDTETLYNSYIELQRKMSAGEKIEPETNETDVNDDNNETGDGLADVGVDDTTDTNDKVDTDAVLKTAEDFIMASEDNKLDETNIEALKSAGLSEAVINTMVKGWSAEKVDAINKQTSEAQKFEREIYDEAGGKEEYQKMFQWLNTQKGGSEAIKDYKELISTGNQHLIKRELASIRNKYKVSADTNGSTAQGGDVYKTAAEYQKETLTNRYNNDPAWNKIVTDKARRSGFLG